MTLVITNCSKRKRVQPDSNLDAQHLEPGATDSVAVDWCSRLFAAEPVCAAQDLYAGRAFVEARRAASVLASRLAVVSAGLGLVDGTAKVPSYSLTTAPRDPNNILRKIDASASDWWAELQTHTPFRSRAVEMKRPAR